MCDMDSLMLSLQNGGVMRKMRKRANDYPIISVLLFYVKKIYRQ